MDYSHKLKDFCPKIMNPFIGDGQKWIKSACYKEDTFLYVAFCPRFIGIFFYRFCGQMCYDRFFR